MLASRIPGAQLQFPIPCFACGHDPDMSSITSHNEVLGAKPIDDRLPIVIGCRDIHPLDWFERLEKIVTTRFWNSDLKIFRGSQRDNRFGSRLFINYLHRNPSDRDARRLQVDFDRPGRFFDHLLCTTERANNNPHTNEFQGILTHPIYMSSECARDTLQGIVLLVCTSTHPGISNITSQN
jgi:hypothetical protein